ncbi:MAG TPA: efflux RND transporter periplasmic adaptor subunit [Acetobacteraceae bacterium]|nr:efflux RND transporter periplasmic adaptor subunit [Acetobacteraceae bacterium]
MERTSAALGIPAANRCRSIKRGRAAFGLGLLLLASLPGCDEPAAQTPQAAPPPPRVTVSEPVRRMITEWDDYTGRFAALAHVEVRARVGGALEGVHFQDGQLVRQGDLLFTIDQRPYQAALAEAQGRLAETRSRLDLTQRELGRATELRRTQAVSEAIVDQRAEAVRSANAMISVAEAQLQRAQLDLSWTRVVSPVTGRIGRHLVSPGNIVSGGDAASTLLAVVVSTDPIDIYYDVDQSAFLRYQRLAREGGKPSARDGATPVQLALGEESEFRHAGQTNFVDNVADSQTGTVRARARFDNADGLFTPGVFARIRVVGSNEYEALMLPDSAIGNDQSRRVVFVVGQDNRVAMREVRLGRLVDGLRIIRQGLAPDDLVVVNGLQRVRAGQPVSPERRPLEVAAAGGAARAGGGR